MNEWHSIRYLFETLVLSVGQHKAPWAIHVLYECHAKWQNACCDYTMIGGNVFYNKEHRTRLWLIAPQLSRLTMRAHSGSPWFCEQSAADVVGAHCQTHSFNLGYQQQPRRTMTSFNTRWRHRTHTDADLDAGSDLIVAITTTSTVC